MTQNKEFHSRVVLTITSTLLLGLLVSACGNKRTIQTVDDSTEYKSAKALPPLKKPSRVITSQNGEQPVAEQTSAAQVDVGEVVDTSLPTSESAPELESQVAESEEVSSVDNAEPVAVLTEETVAPQTVSARVSNDGSGNSVLEIDAAFNQAWEFLTQSLQKSDVTVFARNKEAGRFAIGCAGLAADEVVVKKKGGWSFLSRAKNEQYEYCGLQTIEKRGKTFVRVVNRSGVTVDSENSGTLFERILNN